jgi:hypothetical protein
MNLKVMACGLVLAACSGQAERPLTGQTTPPPATDAARAFRLQYANPGGMWMPQQMTLPGIADTFRNMGVAIDPHALADPLGAPLGAVISLGGCTGSFVSADGLIVTNHHCVQQALQLNTDKKAGRNLVEDGYMAKTRADEKTAGPAARVQIAQAFKDVTRDVRAGLDQIADPRARKDAEDRHIKALIAACEQDRPGIRCAVSSFFNGGQYIQIENLELRDVRLVYAPARSVGDYGGEIDNWHWPRHTGDWAFYRAYVGNDGQPADFSPDNVPFHPKAHLRVSTAGVAAGDFVMVTGYPQYTSRTQTAASLHLDVEWSMPYFVDFYKALYAIAEAHAGDPGETGTKATVMKQGMQNNLAKQAGILAGLVKNPALLAQKDALDRKIQDWAAQPGHEVERAALDKLAQIEAEVRRTARVDFDRQITLFSSQPLATALRFIRWADARTKRDADRPPGFQDRDQASAIAQAKQLSRTYDRTLDRATFRRALVHALEVPEAAAWLGQLLGVRGTLDAAAIDRTLDAWYARPAIEDEATRLALLQTATPAQLAASQDPFIRGALRIWAQVQADERKVDARVGELSLVLPVYVEAMKQVLGGQLAPDANATLRVAFGTVKPERPSGQAFTVASQILAKDTGKEPFNSPAKLLAAIRARKFGRYADPALGGELPINFLSDLDITSGNSGSPVLDRKGELVGLVFDGTLDGVAADIVFDSATQRTIVVDARYMAWTLDLLDGGHHLLKEMGVAAQFRP